MRGDAGRCGERLGEVDIVELGGTAGGNATATTASGPSGGASSAVAVAVAGGKGSASARGT